MAAVQKNWIFKITGISLLPLLMSASLAAKSLPSGKAPSKGDQNKPGTCQPVGSNCFDESFAAPVAMSTATDFLFVVQTSTSLSKELPRIRTGISNFIGSLPANSDFTVAVMLSHGSTSAWSGRLYQTQADPLVLSSKKMSLSEIRNALNQKLTQMVQDADSAGGNEGLFSLFNGINSPGFLAASQAAGFFRSNADLSVVFVSDQRDICAITPAGVPAETDPVKLAARIRDCEGLTVQGLTNRLKQLKGNQAVRISGIVYSKTPVPADTENEIGYGITDIVRLNSGTAIDMAKDDIAQGLKTSIVSPGSSAPVFTLSQTNVDPASVRVTVNGQNIPFQISGNQVSLAQSITSGSIVIIHYCLKMANLSSKAEKLAAIMTMACPIYNKSYPSGYSAPSATEIWTHLKACTPALYPETPTTREQQKTLDRLLDPQDSGLRHKMFHKLWYKPAFSDHFEYYFGLEIKEAVQVFCLNNGGLSDILVTSEYAKAMYDQLDSWQNNPSEQRKWRFAQSLRKQINSCLNR